MEKRDSFIFYRSFFEALQGCPDNTRLAVYEEVMQYALYPDYEPVLSGIEKSLFLLIKPQLDSNIRKRENGKKGAEYGQRGGRPSKNKPQQNPTKTPEKPQQNPTETPNANANVNANANENVNVESTDALHPIRARRGFQKPTIEEVRAYIFERGYIFDADAFWNYYESNGWKVGKNPMKNWKAACSTWNTKEKQNNSKGYGRNQSNTTTNEDVVRNTYEIIREIDQDYTAVREF